MYGPALQDKTGHCVVFFLQASAYLKTTSEACCHYSYWLSSSTLGLVSLPHVLPRSIRLSLGARQPPGSKRESGTSSLNMWLHGLPPPLFFGSAVISPLGWPMRAVPTPGPATVLNGQQTPLLFVFC